MELYIWVILFSSLLLGFSIAMAILFLYSRNHDRKFQESLEDRFSNSITYIINFENQTVKYFNFHDLKTVTTIPYTDFLGRLAEKERNRVSNWIIDLVYGKELLTDENKICVSDIINGKSRNKITHNRILFVANVVDREKKTVYINSNVLNNITLIKRAFLKKTSIKIVKQIDITLMACS